MKVEKLVEDAKNGEESAIEKLRESYPETYRIFMMQREQEQEEREAKEEAERRAKEEAERKAKEEAERKAKEEAERKAKEEAERKEKIEKIKTLLQNETENNEGGIRKTTKVIVEEEWVGTGVWKHSPSIYSGYSPSYEEKERKLVERESVTELRMTKRESLIRDILEPVDDAKVKFLEDCVEPIYQAQLDDIMRSKDEEMNKPYLFIYDIDGRKDIILCTAKIAETFNEESPIRNAMFCELDKYFGENTELRDAFVNNEVDADYVLEELPRLQAAAKMAQRLAEEEEERRAAEEARREKENTENAQLVPNEEKGKITLGGIREAIRRVLFGRDKE